MADEMNAPTMNDCFVAAIQALRDNGWLVGTQKEMAANLDLPNKEKKGVTPSHLSQVFQGARVASPHVQEAIAKYMGFRMEDVLKIGRALIERRGFMPFIGQIEQFPANSEAQAQAIVELTNKQFGLTGHLLGYQPQGWESFVAGKMTAAEFYAKYLEELQSVTKAIRSHG